MAKDPVCGMTVDEATALKAERDGQTYYFCSEHCRQKFLGQGASENPTPSTVAHEEHSSSGDEHTHSHQEHHGEEVKPSANAKYFCPMCAGVESDKPGDCPKCGMALERNPASKPPNKTVYTCPMHPEIEQDHPGDCPKCGMTLESKTIRAGDEEEQKEIRALSRKFWSALVLTIPVLLIAMGHAIPGLHIDAIIPKP